MDKLIFKRPKKKNTCTGGGVIRVTASAYDVIADISAETGKSVSYIASNMIEFASKYTEVQDDDGSEE